MGTVTSRYGSHAVRVSDYGNHGGKGTMVICHSNVLVLAICRYPEQLCMQYYFFCGFRSGCVLFMTLSGCVLFVTLGLRVKCRSADAQVLAHEARVLTLG